MRPSDVISQLGIWEREFPVDDWQAGGIEVWPLIRLDLAFKVLATGENRPRPPAVPRPVWREVVGMARYAAAGLRDRRSNLHGLPKADACFLGTPTNRQPLNGRWYDRYIDPLADVLAEHALSSVHLERARDGAAYRVPRHRPSFLLQSAVFRARVRSRLRRKQVKPTSLDGYAVFRRRVTEQFPGVAVPDTSWIAARIGTIGGLADYFDGLLKQVAPRVVFCTCYYSSTRIGFALCLAASRRGIPSVDIQHGVTRRHPAYDGWTRFPAGGYALLPNVFWCWTVRDADPVAGWPERARAHHRAIVGGHPWMAMWQSGGETRTALLDEVGAIKGRSFNVLVALTWSSGLSEGIKAALRTSPADWTWWIRLHPTMDKDRQRIRRWCATEAAGRVHVGIPTDLPLPVLLRHADVLLAHNSTVIQEAVAMGLPSVTIDPRAVEMYPEELASGWMRYAQTPSDVHRALRKQICSKQGMPSGGAYPSREHLIETLLGLFDQRA